MRKIVSTIILVLAALTMWGQTTQTFDKDKMSDELSKLIENKDIVNQQATAKGKATYEESDSLQTYAFDRMQFILNNYDFIKDDHELESEASRLSTQFIHDFTLAIIASETDPRISIGSRKFLEVVESYRDDFDSFSKKAQEYIKSKHPETTQPAETEVEELNDEDETSATPQKEPTQVSTLMQWISFSLGLLGCILCICSFFHYRKLNHRINRRRQEIEQLRKDLSKKIDELKPSSYRGIPSSSYTPQQTYQPRQEVPRQVEKTTQTIQRKEPIQKKKVEEQPSVTYLYATIKAQSPYAEFFKVANENSGDKVFMLILSHANADAAEFTIAPNMSADFMKSVITDRDTYLPALFCEKSIDTVNPTHIDVVSVGKAKKTDGKWTVQERMNIRLV